MDGRNRGLWIMLSLLALVVLLGPALGMGMLGMGGPMGPGMMRPWLAGNGWGWGLAMGLGWLGMLAFWGALIVGAVLLSRALGAGPRHGGAPEDDAHAIVRRRYASGEITREQYDQMRATLEGKEAA